MPTSEARIRANRENSRHSTGPRTPSGLDRSRRNAITHGQTCSTLIRDADVPEVERRTAALMAELDPRSTLGKHLVGQLAIISVRIDNGITHEFATSASRVRNAITHFDHAREDRVEELFDALADDPRKHVRLLKRMPEGVDRLIEGWEEIRADLTRADGPLADESRQATATHMLGYRAGQFGSATVEGLFRAARGEESPAATGGDPEARRAWARGLLLELIDREIAGLEAHREAHDIEAIEQDRIEAPGRALFDFSPEGCRALRYQSEAQRLFFKTLKEFRLAEAEAEAAGRAAAVPQPQPAPMPMPMPTPAPVLRPSPQPTPPLASFREKPAPTPRQPEPTPADLIFGPTSLADGQPRGLDGRVLAVGRAVVIPG